MIDEIDTDELKARRICADCVHEEFLSNLIETKGSHGTCHYCEGDGQTFTLDQIAEVIATAFSQHYQRTDPNPTSLEYAMMHDKESPVEWYRRGETVSDTIQDMAVMDEVPSNDIAQILRDDNASNPFDDDGSEDEFGDESQYERKELDGECWQQEWTRFERALKTETRYFSEELRTHLVQLFEDIGTKKTKDGNGVIVEAGAGLAIQSFYRARVFESHAPLADALISPESRLGPPPPAFAQSGRMNARGIAVFYGADEEETALAEVRPPVGAKVAIARFKLKRLVKLLDLKSFAQTLETGSVFDPSFARRKERALFLERLVKRMTMPVMPSDEALDYLPTQAIADFLASLTDPEVDGILFPSVQVRGKINVVLFHKAARIAPISYPKGTKLSLDTGSFNGEEYERELTVVEAVPAVEKEEPKPQPTIFGNVNLGSLPSLAWDEEPDPDPRPVTLEVELDTLEVREVTGVKYETVKEKVGRRRYRVRKRSKPADF